MQLVAYVFTFSPTRQIKDPAGSISLTSFEMNIVKTGEGKGAWSEAHARSQSKATRSQRAL